MVVLSPGVVEFAGHEVDVRSPAAHQFDNAGRVSDKEFGVVLLIR